MVVVMMMLVRSGGSKVQCCSIISNQCSLPSAQPPVGDSVSDRSVLTPLIAYDLALLASITSVRRMAIPSFLPVYARFCKISRKIVSGALTSIRNMDRC